ncbi:V-set domain-containing T-cell activation inhibitor 1-like isoform X3 [Brachyhypopomus gauderio]|uniref:V-set domain-containing T-cell activation inhibitor 1-like isoform X3 n=1 Tax=Brachyhypopomus gauderio TaxID=698409 RepID=UPI004042D6E2
MGNRNCFYFMFLWLIHRASLKNIPVVAVVHGTVILPCSHNDEKLRSGSAEIFWRYGDSRTVLDLKGNTVHVAEQDEMFRGRVDNFPGEYTKGNFSIRLRDVKLSDAGTYTCFIPLVAEEQKLDLTVEESSMKDSRIDCARRLSAVFHLAGKGEETRTQLNNILFHLLTN